MMSNTFRSSVAICALASATAFAPAALPTGGRMTLKQTNGVRGLAALQRGGSLVHVPRVRANTIAPVRMGSAEGTNPVSAMIGSVFGTIAAMCQLVINLLWSVIMIPVLSMKAMFSIVEIGQRERYPSGSDDLVKYFEGNKRFIEKTNAKDPEAFKKMGAGQAPKFLWIGCSDARIPANEVIGLGPGEVFVHRNVANQVINTDMNMMSVLQYSVENLGVENIIVAGHYQCGGVKAACSQNDHHAPLENWIRSIRDVQRMHQDELSAIQSEDERHRRLVEINTMEQALNVWKTAVVQRRRTYTYVRDGEFTPKIFAIVVDPATGEFKDLGFDPAQSVDEKTLNLYKLYDEKAAKEAYSEIEEPYTTRPSTWRKRRMYNRQPISMLPQRN